MPQSSPPALPDAISSALTSCLEPYATPWHGGQLMAFSGLDGPTDYEQGLVLRTEFGKPGLQLKLPAAGRLRFPSAGDRAVVTNDAFCFLDGSLRGALVDAHHLVIYGDVVVDQLDPALACVVDGGRTLICPRDRCEVGWIDTEPLDVLLRGMGWLEAKPVPFSHSPLRRRTLARALSVMRGQVYTPEGLIRRRWTTPDRWPHRGMWLWDSAFHAIGWRHLDPAFARELLTAVLDAQDDDGFVPHFITPSHRSPITQPPVLTLAASLIDAVAPDPPWLAELYPKLGAYVAWDLRSRDTDGDGLVEWFIEEHLNCRSGESGMDNSPRFDSACQLGATDFNAYLGLECELLAGFARRLGRDEEAAAWDAEANRLRQLLHDRLFSDRAGLFLDFDGARGKQSPVLASSGFMPLLCGAADDRQLAALLRHLDAAATFGTPVPLPSAVATPDHGSTDMWRGPMWVCVNWLVAHGLDRYGEHARAGELRARTVAEIERRFDQFGVFFEYYDAWGETPPPRLMRKGRVAPLDEPEPFPHQVIHDFGWTATLYVDMVCRAGVSR